MEFVTFLWVILSVTQILMADDTSENFARHVLVDINVFNIEIPENSWYKGIETTELQKDSWKFDWVEYLKDIPEDSPITLDYTVQWVICRVFGFILWRSLYKGSTPLCNTDTPDSNIAALVRELLGIPEGCSVSAGEKRNTSGIHFPLKEKVLFLDSRTRGAEIRIVINMRENPSALAQELFSAEFNILSPVRLLS